MMPQTEIHARTRANTHANTTRPQATGRRWRDAWRDDTWIRPYFSRYRRTLAAALMLGIAAAAFSAALMFTSGYLISRTAEMPELVQITAALAFVQIFGIGKPLLAYFERLASHDWVLRMTSSLRLRLYRSLEPDAVFWSALHRVGDALGLLAEDIGHVQNLYLRVIFPTVIAWVLWLAVCAGIGALTPLMGLVALLALGVTTLLLPVVSVLVNGARQMRAKGLRSKLYAELTDDVLGVADWVFSGRRAEFVDQVEKTQADLRKTEEQMARFARWRDLGAQVLLGLLAVALLAWAASHFGGQVGGASNWIAAFVLGFFPLIDVFAPLSDAAVEANAHLDSIERLNAQGDVEDDEEGVTEPADAASLARKPVTEGPAPEAVPRDTAVGLRLAGLRFAYPGSGEEVLRGIDLDVEPGQHVAVLGPSGAGKSTLAALIRGDLVPSSGTIELVGSGAGAAAVTPASLGDAVCSYVGVIQQKTHLFNTSLYENLRIARPSATREEALAALEQVGLGDLVRRLPHGIDSLVDEAGLRFSGGERHRIALARVLLQDVPLVLLDEPTVGLDPRTESELLETLFCALADKTLVMVTHHLLGVSRMDRVVFVEDGRIALDGSPAELEHTSERYRRLLAFDRGA